MSIFYILLLFSCLGVVASCEVEHKDIGWKDAGSKSDLAIEEAEHIAKFQSFAAPDGKVAQNQTVEVAEHIAEYYIDVFNKLVKVNNSTELALYFENEFLFSGCWRGSVANTVETDGFLKLVYIEQADWKLIEAKFLSSNFIRVTLDMNKFGYVETVNANLRKQPDGSWQWSYASCRSKTCVDPKRA